MLDRDKLPQIPKDEVRNFIKFMEDHGVSMEEMSVPANKLKPIQNEVNKDKVKNMVKNFDKEFKDGWPSLICSEDMYILDGHHRWIAHAVARPDENVGILCFKCPIKDLLRLGHEFEGSFTKTIDESMTTYKQLALSMI
jgi:hypothetical protein